MPDGLDEQIKKLPNLPDVRHFFLAKVPSVKFGFPLFSLGGEGVMASTQGLRSLTDCLDSLRAVLYDVFDEEKPLASLNEKDDLEKLVKVASACIGFIVRHVSARREAQAKPSGVLVRASLLPTELRPEAIPVLRDALLAFHFGKARLHGQEWPEHYLTFLFLLRFWDEHSLITSGRDDRDAAYGELLDLHMEVNKWYNDCQPGCLKSYLSSLWRVNPGSMLEAIAWLGDRARQHDESEYHANVEYEDDAWLLEDEDLPLDDARPVERPDEFIRSHVRSCAANISKHVADLDLDGVTLLLQTFGRFGGIERKVLLDLFGVRAHGIEIQDIASSLAAVAYNAHRGRTSAAPADKLGYFQRAIELIGDIRRAWSSEKWFVDGKQANDLNGSLSLQGTLEAAEAALKSAIPELPISLKHVNRRWVRETFYFAFLVDHENFWRNGVAPWLESHRPDLWGYRDPAETGNMFDKEYIFKHRNAYYKRHMHLMNHMISNLRQAWLTYCGVSEFDYPKAYAYWKFYPDAHPDAYGQFNIHPERPGRREKKLSEAVDLCITIDMLNDIQTEATKLKKKGFYVIVSGDADYVAPLEQLRRKGAEYQYWYFDLERQEPAGGGRAPQKSYGAGERQVGRRITSLPSERRVRLQDILHLDRFNWRNAGSYS